MKTFWYSVVAVMCMSGLAFAQSNPCVTGNWTITNQPPDNCMPFAQVGVWTKPLPNAGAGGPMNHLAANSAAIIANIYNSVPGDNGTWRAAGPNNFHQDTLGEPIYYGRASDPVYRVTACDLNTSNGYPTSFPQWNPIGKTYHIPNKALPGNCNPATSTCNPSDKFFVAWDQVSNQVLGVYNSGTSFYGLPQCPGGGHAGTNADPCLAPAWRACDQVNWSTGQDFKITPGATGALDVPAWTGVIRTNEWMHGAINHAIYMNTACLGSATTVFPDSSGPAGVCSTLGKSDANRPQLGALVFFDYTDAQIDAMNLPAWQKPIVMALAHYGGYIGDTNSGRGTLAPSRMESDAAYEVAGTQNPLYGWLTGQSGVTKSGASDSSFTYAMSLLAGIPNVNGTGPIAHMRIADPCISLGLAGLSGGA